MYADVIEQQLKSIQSLAAQWRIQLAVLRGGSSGSSLSSTEDSRSMLPDVMHGEPLSHFNNDKLSIASPHHEASGDPDIKSSQMVRLLIFVFVLLNLLYCSVNVLQLFIGYVWVAVDFYLSLDEIVNMMTETL